jgi:hypothetical protein
MGRQSSFAYVKVAALNRWNLLLLASGGAATIVADVPPELGLPVLAALEVAVLGLVSLHPRFRALVDAEATHRGAHIEKAKAQERLQGLLTTISPERMARFESLKTRCGTLRASVAVDDATASAVAEEQISFVDKLLWVFVKLLDTEQALQRFLSTVSERDLVKDIQRAKQRLDILPLAGKDALEDRKRATLEDTLQTLTQRRANVVRAQHNHELVELEIQRIEQKLNIIVELAVNRQDPAILTAEVGAMADSVKATEETLGELHVFTGPQVDLEVPRILVEEKENVAVRRR